MSVLKDGFGEAVRKNIFTAGLSKEDIFLNNFEGIDHPKFFIVAGISGDKVFTCSIYINSEIHSSIIGKPQLVSLQIPLMSKFYAFLKYDSFACCSTPLFINTEKIHQWMQNGSCKVIGSLTKEDLAFVSNAIVGSGLLADEELALFFS